jgi:hypothetical protein
MAIRNYYFGRGRAPHGMSKTKCVKGICSHSNIFTDKPLEPEVLRNLSCDPRIRIFEIRRIQ